MYGHFINLTSLFGLPLATLFVPVVAVLLTRKPYRPLAVHVIPLGLTLMFFFLHTVSAVVYQAIGFGWAKYLFVLGASSLAMYFSLAQYRRAVDIEPQPHDGRVLLVILVLAFIMVLDNFYVGIREGYFQGVEPYLRNAFTSDMTRTVILTNALVREDGSPFMPGTDHLYQLFWHHGAALFVSLFPQGDSYALVYGYTLVTAYLFYVVLLWTLYALRPSLFLNYRYFILFALIMLVHAEVVNMVLSYLREGAIGIASDGSFLARKTNIFSDFILETATIASPQHVAFLIMLLVFLVVTTVQSVKDLPRARYYGGAVAVAMFIASPVLWVLSFPIYLAWKMAQWVLKQLTWKVAIRHALLIGGLILACYLAYILLLRVSPLDLITRPAVGVGYPVEIVLRDLIRMPVVLVWILGPLGLYILGLMILNYWYKQPVQIQGERFLLMLIALVFIILSQDGEIRRHVNLILAIAAMLYAVSITPLNALQRFPYMALLIFCAFLGMSGQAYYIYSFTHKPSILATDIDWRDYFCMNKVIASKYPKTPTLAAWQESGLRFPIVMQVTSSFATPGDAYAHSRLSGEQHKILDKVNETAMPYYKPYLAAKELGFKLLVWGPAEKGVWGKAGSIVPEGAEPVATCGAVFLYELSQ